MGLCGKRYPLVALHAAKDRERKSVLRPSIQLAVDMPDEYDDGWRIRCCISGFDPYERKLRRRWARIERSNRGAARVLRAQGELRIGTYRRRWAHGHRPRFDGFCLIATSEVSALSHENFPRSSSWSRFNALAVTQSEEKLGEAHQSQRVKQLAAQLRNLNGLI